MPFDAVQQLLRSTVRPVPTYGLPKDGPPPYDRATTRRRGSGIEPRVSSLEEVHHETQLHRPVDALQV